MCLRIQLTVFCVFPTVSNLHKETKHNSHFQTHGEYAACWGIFLVVINIRYICYII